MMNSLSPLPFAPHSASTTILIVDDELDLLELTALYLSKVGYRTLRAPDATTALSVLRHHPDVDLIFTDIMMPGGLDGVELVRRARLFRPNLKVVFSSGSLSDDVAVLKIKAAGDLFLYKPYRFADLDLILHRSLAGHAELSRPSPPPDTQIIRSTQLP